MRGWNASLRQRLTEDGVSDEALRTGAAGLARQASKRGLITEETARGRGAHRVAKPRSARQGWGGLGRAGDGLPRPRGHGSSCLAAVASLIRICRRGSRR